MRLVGLRLPALAIPRVAGPMRRVHVRQFGAKGDGSTDDTRALRHAFEAGAGGIVQLDQATYRTSDTVFIVGSGTLVEGARAVIGYRGGETAVDFALDRDGACPRCVTVRHLGVDIHPLPGVVGVRVRTRDSCFDNVDVGLKRGATRAVAFDIVGAKLDGSGPRNNHFLNCTVQGQGSEGRQTGVRFSPTERSDYAAASTTWVGGRIGQCHVAFDVAGRGNSFLGATIEGCETAFSFNDASGNFAIGTYLELIETGFRFGITAVGNGIVGVFATGVKSLTTGLGASNWMLVYYPSAALPMGLKLGNGKGGGDGLDLNRYLEGDWQPRLTGTNRAGRYTVTSSTAKYVRVGRQVTAIAEMRVTVDEAGSGLARFGGLPFPHDTLSPMSATILTANVAWPHLRAISARAADAAGTEGFFLTGMNSDGQLHIMLAEDIGEGAECAISITYGAASD